MENNHPDPGAGRAKKRPRTESVKDKDETVDNFDEHLYHYYHSRAENTVKIAEDQIIIIQKLDEEEDIDPKRLCWNSIKGDDKRCLVLTGFSVIQFIELLTLCESSIPTNIGRGKQSKFTQADKFLVVLCYVKHYETQAKLGDNFGVSKAQINRIIAVVVPIITSILYLKYVVDLEVDLPEYEAFPDARFVIDVTIQKIWRPLGTFQERKQFYSGKHKIYGLKSLTLHYRNGSLVACWAGTPGAVHDVVIANEHYQEIKRLIEEEERMREESKIFADKGFLGCEGNLPVLIPYKKKPNRELTPAQVEQNKALSSHRVICERWYGRLKGLFRIIAAEYHNDRDDYPLFFRLCSALTNYHILKHPL